MIYTDHVDYFREALNHMRQKYCNMRGFKGQIYCPHNSILENEEGEKSEITVHQEDTKKNVYSVKDNGVIFSHDDGSFKRRPRFNETLKTSTSSEKRNLIISGFGFDRVKRVMKYPVFDSNLPAIHEQPKVEHTTSRFSSVREFLTHVYQSKHQFQGGLYVTNDQELRSLANKFGDYRVNIGTTQRLYVTHSTTVKSRQVLEEFKEIVNSLPPYDKNNQATKQLYDMFIEFFGTDVSISTEHGGIIYQQVSLKSCYGGSITQDMLNDIDALIRRVPPGNSAYLRFRQLGHNNILGGNPEFTFDKINERINSFQQAPAAVRFNAIPIYDAINDGTRKEWVRQAINDYLQQNTQNVETIMREVEHARHQNFIGKQTLWHVDQQNVQKARMVAYWVGAPLIQQRTFIYTPNFNLQKSPVSLAANENYKSGENNWFNQVILHSFIQRNALGQVRQYVMHNGKELRTSPWISSGCTFVPWGPRWCNSAIGCLNIYDVLRRGVCIDCLPTYVDTPAEFNTKHRALQCPCSGF